MAPAWIRYVKPAAPVSLWCNWLAWTPVLAIGSGLGAGYLLSVFFSPDASINTWQVTLVHLGFIKSGLLGAGANAWGSGTLITGWACALIAVPVFYHRHKVVDKGRFPEQMFADLLPAGETELGPKRSGPLPYLAIAVGIGVMLAGYFIFWG